MITETPSKDAVYIRPENLAANFKAMGKSLAVSTCHFEILAPNELRDFDWNHMDQLHRPHVHHTYEESLRLFRGHNFAVSLTRVGPFKLLTQVIDIQLAPGTFYQGFTLFSLFYIHVVLSSIPEAGANRMMVDVYIVSHRFFKFLHGILRRRLIRLNEVQNKEDTPLRDRRTALRAKGYRFGSDDPDFLNSNVVTNNVIPPRLKGTHRFPVMEMPLGTLTKISAGPIDLLVRKNENYTLTVWTAVCPHEGGPLELGTICNHVITCPWHGLRQNGVNVSEGNPQDLFGDLRVYLDKNELVVLSY